MEEAKLFLAFPVFVISMVCVIIYVVYDLCLKPKFLRAKLIEQGIDGPKPTLIMGNMPDIRQIKSKELVLDAVTYDLNKSLSLDCC
ncbi:hypothetical protein DCAR_0104158 [Daucus carota subsp. sativus]|uniref:Uncharacterized protein n=1 Tax=Daucus carota subsp. sativus TaxID=79200 RepID=A0A166ILH9_DAUCS|nr:hypothetical protein DCAR_0104158 [Daucus carota subsp. sativus]